MTALFKNLTPEQKTTLRNVALGYIAWVIISIFAWCFLLPAEWLWVAYGPVLFAMLVIIITGILIIAHPILPKPIGRVFVGRHRVTACQFCPMADVKDNPVYGQMPVVKCRETAKVCYQPMQIPRCARMQTNGKEILGNGVSIIRLFEFIAIMASVSLAFTILRMYAVLGVNAIIVADPTAQSLTPMGNLGYAFLNLTYGLSVIVISVFIYAVWFLGMVWICRKELYELAERIFGWGDL